MTKYFFDISAGRLSGLRRHYKFGKNPDIDANQTEDVISTGGTWTPPATAATVTIVSASANDTAAGTGARTLTLTGLDHSYSEKTETITLNGTNAVTSTTLWNIVYRMVVNTAGSTGANEGALTCTSTASGTPVMASIRVGENQSQFAVYQVPVDKNLYLFSWGGGCTTTGGLELALYVNLRTGVRDDSYSKRPVRRVWQNYF